MIPGTGGTAWYWASVALSAAGHRVIVVDLPADDDNAGLSDYADAVCAAVGVPTGPLVVVAQSMGPTPRHWWRYACRQRSSCW